MNISLEVLVDKKDEIKTTYNLEDTDLSIELNFIDTIIFLKGNYTSLKKVIISYKKIIDIENNSFEILLTDIKYIDNAGNIVDIPTLYNSL